ncbi:MAG: CoA ester lyase [Sphingopyxis sp.]|nr:CoA ester lyase [Sphingopyxis sp.]
MRLRSLLFVPGDRPDRMEKALASGADALILDLEDAVAPTAKATARHSVADFIARQPGGPAIFVRLNPLDSGLIDDDLAALRGVTPDGFVLPKAVSGASVDDLAQRLSALGNITSGILAIATEVPQALFGLGSYGGTARLLGLSWGAEDLPAAIGATSSREEDGRYTPVYEVVRTLALMGAHAADVLAIDTVYPAFKDSDGLAAYAMRARRDGFNGMLAIHPAQVPVINAAFTPSAAEVEHARAVVAAFAANPGAGALALDGKMIDAPHLKAAHRVLAQIQQD